MKTKSTGGSSALILLSLLFLLVLSGCSVEAKAGFLHFTGIMSDEDYQTYIQLVNEGSLAPDSTYVAVEMEDESQLLPPEGSIHVTFAENAYIDVQYYRDSGLTDPIDSKWCYLMPGDCVYASEPNCTHPSSQWYKFDCFSVYACNESGRRTKELSWEDDADPSLVLRVPADQAASEISVIPMGKYEKRTLELTDYYTDSSGRHQELAGTWTVNDAETSTGRVEISPVESLSIDYQFDETKYDFVSSYPANFYHEKGLVRFETTFASSGIEQYSVELRELAGNFRFDPSQYRIEHGAVAFSYNGRPIDSVTDIVDGGSIHYAAIPDTGYRPTNGEGEITVDASDPDKTDANIRAAIEFYPDEDVTVNLLQPEMGGTIEYSVDGKPLSGEKCALRCGTIITMKFNHWNGWIIDANAKNEYIVTADKIQTVSIDGSDFSKLFTESDDHKPTLNVVVKDSMKSATFAILASENGKNDRSYEKGSKTSIIPDLLGQNDREIFGGEKVGTGRDIVLAVTNDTIFSGYAMKLETVTKDMKGAENKSIQYVTDLPVEKPIGLYSGSQQAASSTVYESITITVSKVEVSTYNTMPTDHSTITIRLADDNDSHILQNGEVLESSRNVEVIITPENGYYITGSKLNSGVYSETMKYSKWEKDYQKVLEKHPAQKLWYVTLDTSDNFGTCVYKLDGAEVSGTIGIREGQKLTLDYTLTDPDYQIIRSAWALWESTEAKTVTISIDESLDGRTIHRSDYITVERKEG